ncbi:MAG TPA: hypothetical protein DEH15_18770 [Marinilabiliales bacterium]|nr:hypothetical protein [Marinilabiliales bacterium]
MPRFLAHAFIYDFAKINYVFASFSYIFTNCQRVFCIVSWWGNKAIPTSGDIIGKPYSKSGNAIHQILFKLLITGR